MSTLNTKGSPKPIVINKVDRKTISLITSGLYQGVLGPFRLLGVGLYQLLTV